MALTNTATSIPHASPTADHTVVVSLGRLTTDRQLYTASINGEVLVTSSRDPETDAARALVSRGYTGTVQFVKARGLRPYTRPLKLASLALTVVRETAFHGPVVERHVPFDEKPPSKALQRDAQRPGAEA